MLSPEITRDIDRDMINYLTNRHCDQLQSILSSTDQSHRYPLYPLYINFAELMNDYPYIAQLISVKPTCLPKFDHAAVSSQRLILKDSESEVCSTVKRVRVCINVLGSPLGSPETYPSIGELRVEHRDISVTLEATVIRSGAIKTVESEKRYECRKCKNVFSVYPESETGKWNIIKPPLACLANQSQDCDSNKFLLVENRTKYNDYQVIKIQDIKIEKFTQIFVGSIPRFIRVILRNDLVDTVKAGDDVIITGVLTAKQVSELRGVICDLEPILIATHVRRTNELKSEINIPENDIWFEKFWEKFSETPLKGRNTILKGICPQVFGLFPLKLVVALTLIGGVQHVDASGKKTRGESHLLLVGDPGTGKSQFLKFAAKLSNRAVITTELGSTSAGLTVSAVKDSGEWMLEAGALVLADGGLCCIDEFDSMREHDRFTIHEAMERQTISVAKAGIVTTLSTRTTVFGATNLERQYDPSEPLFVNTTLSGPLISRFDIVLVLLEKKNPDWDKVFSSHILVEEDSGKGKDAEDLTNIWSVTMLKRYFTYVKESFEPVLGKDAERVISSYCQLRQRRRLGTVNAARITVLMRENLIRLAEAHARLMFSNEVTQSDAITAILCMESSMTNSAIVDSGGNAMRSNFTENPDVEYAKHEKMILEKLRLL